MKKLKRLKDFEKVEKIKCTFSFFVIHCYDFDS